MSDSDNQQKPEKSKGGALGVISTLFTMLIIIGGAAGILYWIYSSEPEAQREGATKKTAILVDVQQVRRGNYTPIITGLGRVEASEDIILSPRVDGRVINISENFVPGGFVNKDDVLVEIDPSDYKNTVRQRESELRQAQSELDIEFGRRDVAQKEYELLDQKISEENKKLVLRQPQLESARATVLSAQAALDQAKLELERTTIEAPFDAQILSRNVSIGSQVEPGMTLARLVGVDEYWVIVTVPLSKLSQIGLPAQWQKGAPVKLRNRTAWPEGVERTGYVSRLIGAVDNETRLARLLVVVEDPLARDPGTQGPQMIVGTIVQARIQGRTLNNVVRINRDFLREGNTVWVKDNGKLAIRKADVAFMDKQYAYIANGLEDGDLLVTGNLATVAEGVALRTEGENTVNDAQGTSE